MAADLMQNYKEETKKWEAVNRELRHHGLQAIKLMEPHDLIKTSDAIGFTLAESHSLRDNLVVLMKDGDRRQTLIQDLILTNNNLRTELETHGNSGSEYEDRIIDLRNMLDGANSKIMELEAKLEQQMDHSKDNIERDQNTKVAAQARSKQLEKRCELQEQEIERLRSKVKQAQTDHDKREQRVTEVLQDMRKGSYRGVTSADKRLLDVIDSYESELCQLKRQLVTLQDGSTTLASKDADFIEETSHRYKELIKGFNKDLRNCEAELKKQREKNEIIQLELQARPSADTYNKAKVKCRQLEKLLQEHSINVYGGKAFNKKVYSTKVEDVDYLPLQHCRMYLKEVCKHMQLTDLEQFNSAMLAHKNAVEGYPKVEELLGQIVEVVEPSQALELAKKHKTWCSKHWKTIIPTLELWSRDMKILPELRHVVRKLVQQFDSGEECLSDQASLGEIVQSLEHVTADMPLKPTVAVSAEKISPKVLLKMVKHFQHLFDVPSVSGVYPRMSELYTRYSEMKNVMRTLAELLDLGENYKGSDIVDTVGRVCQSYTSSTYKQLKQLLQEDDLDSVIQRLDEQRKFMPLFREIIDQLMDVLDVSRIDQIIPATKALKLMVC